MLSPYIYGFSFIFLSSRGYPAPHVMAAGIGSCLHGGIGSELDVGIKNGVMMNLNLNYR